MAVECGLVTRAEAAGELARLAGELKLSGNVELGRGDVEAGDTLVGEGQPEPGPSHMAAIRKVRKE